MFRMEFQTVDKMQGGQDDESSNGDYMNDSVYERYTERVVDVSCSFFTPTVYEGRVGKFGKVKRLSSSNTMDHSAEMSSGRKRVSSSKVAVAASNNWKEADLMNFDSPSLQGVTQDEKSHQAIFLDAKVLRELVQAVSTSHHSTVRDDTETMSVSSHSPAVLLSRTDSMRSTSSFRSDSSSNASECSFTETKHKFGPPTEEPLLADHEQAKINAKSHKEARIEAKRVAEEEKQEYERQQREIRDLANCVNDVSSSGSSFKKNKVQKLLRKTGVTGLYRFLKNPFRVFRTRKDCPAYPVARQNTVVIPKMGMFSGCHSSSTTANATLSQMRSAPRQQTRPDIQFATVKSTQRDVAAWTMEEYMIRNGRKQKWNRRNDDEEFGGIEGNNMMNQHFDDDVRGGAYDSDSD